MRFSDKDFDAGSPAHHHQMRQGIKRYQICAPHTCKVCVEKETPGNKRSLFDLLV
jgi:hypothetical protein